MVKKGSVGGDLDGNRITGTAFTPDGVPLTGRKVKVDINSENGETWLTSGETTVLSDGSFTIDFPTFDLLIGQQVFLRLWDSPDGYELGNQTMIEPSTDWVTNPANGHLYKIVSGETWEESESNAVAQGAHLVTINDEDEQIWLVSTFGSEEYRIGFTDKNQEGLWEWVSGEASTYTNWADGEPNNHGGNGEDEDYAVMNADLSGRWNDISSGGGRAIMEKVPAPITHTITPPSVTTVSQGGVLGPFFVKIQNNSDSYYVYYVQPYLVKPDGTTINFRRRISILDVGETRRRVALLRIPRWSELGTFIHGVKITDTDGNVIDEDTFEFTVVSAPVLAAHTNAVKIDELMNDQKSMVMKKGGWGLIVAPCKKETFYGQKKYHYAPNSPQKRGPVFTHAVKKGASVPKGFLEKQGVQKAEGKKGIRKAGGFLRGIRKRG